MAKLITHFVLYLLLAFLNLRLCKSSCESNAGVCTSKRPIRYLFYDVNAPEGFNLRRDVYLRIAVLATKLQSIGQWVLVLPPWSHLYHWRSRVAQERLPWSVFFDVPSLQKFAPVIELIDFLDVNPNGQIDQIFVLQHFEDMFNTGNFVDKLELQNCTNPHRFVFDSSGTNRYHAIYPAVSDVFAERVDCLSFHGEASVIVPFLKQTKHSSIMLDHAEVMLHDSYGSVAYWRARRSMRFAQELRNFAADFRKKNLNSTDHSDGTLLPQDWTLEKPKRTAKGGPYLSVHLRRRDFIQARLSEVPTLTGAVEQISKALKQLKLDTVFIATDAPQHEKYELREELKKNGFKMVTFQASAEELKTIKDGGVAIVEQIICSHARMFFGTHESTFSYRIQEEREILGFPADTTFNRLCGDSKTTCQQPSRWLIKY